MNIQRPKNGDCHDYYFMYIDLVPEGEIVTLLDYQLEDTTAMLLGLSSDFGDFRYKEGKWSVKEVLGHLVDAERLMASRALWFGRNNPGPLTSIEQDELVKYGNFGKRSLTDLVEEYRWVRKSNIVMFRSFDEEACKRRGIASEREFTVNSIPYIIAGHELHHIKVLQEKYLA